MSSSPRVIPLDDVRADGWFERLGEGSAAFAQLNGIVGSRFVAFAIVAGLRITALAVDPRNPEASQIEFSTEGGAPQRMQLGEFKKRLAAALLGEDEPAPPLGENPRGEEIQAALGFRYVLLCPIFGIRLEQLKWNKKGEPLVVIERAGGKKELAIADLREMVRQGIRDEAQRASQPRSPFSIDLEAVRQARIAAQNGGHERVVQLLGGWPGPLSMLLRTMEGQNLGKDVRATIAEGLGLLGSAYAELDRGDWGLEVLRLAIQWGQDGAVTADLFRRLGAAHLVGERPGEAIGMFRRALALGGDEKTILPDLARAYSERDRRIAALLTLERATELGVPEGSLVAVRDAAREHLGESWTRFRAYVSG